MSLNLKDLFDEDTGPGVATPVIGTGEAAPGLKPVASCDASDRTSGDAGCPGGPTHTGPVPPAAASPAAPTRGVGGPSSYFDKPVDDPMLSLHLQPLVPSPRPPKRAPAPTESHDAGREAYVAIPGMNWSTLKHMARSPKHFQFRLKHPEPEKPAYKVGRAFHCALLEPATFTERYVVEPDFGDLRTKAGKARRDAWHPEGREPLSQDDMKTILAMAAAVREHKVARALLDVIVPEKTIEWKDEETGLACKARLDMLGPDFLADVKTSRDPAPHAFARDASTHMYHGQAAFYFDGARTLGLIPKDADPPFLIVPEKEEPYDVVVMRLHRNLALAPGRALYRRLLRRFLECEAAGWWPGLAPELKILELPPWAIDGDGGGDEFDVEGL